MQIERSILTGIVLLLLGKRLRGLRLEDTGVTILGPRPHHLSFANIVAPATIDSGLSFCSVSLAITDGSKIRVTGLNTADACAFVRAMNAKWQSVISAHVATNAAEINALVHVVECLAQPRRYPAACLLEPYRARTAILFSKIPWQLPAGALPADQAHALNTLAAFQRDSFRYRDRAVDRFITQEIRGMNEFFEKIESKPLTPEQRKAVVTDEDATLVLASAGSGKTSVITAKAAYLLERRLRLPEEILLIAFGRDAAAEMKERIKQRCGIPVTAKTFHALAYGIIAEVEGQAPALAAHAADDVLFYALLRDILVHLMSKSGNIASNMLRWFIDFFFQPRSILDFKTLHEYYSYVEEQELRTLQGELVKSFEELEIANWLYLNAIAYEYEPVYEHLLPENSRRVYQPDFRLTECGVYIEHFGVRKARGQDGREQLTTAPGINRDDYLADMAWKRQIHAKHCTTLIETFSYEQVEGHLIDSLAKKLKPYVTLKPLPAEKVFERIDELGQVDIFTKTLGAFLRHFKGNGLTVDVCRKRNERQKLPARGLAFLELFLPVFAEYQQRLGPRIDFDDIIKRATEHVRARRYNSPYRHLLVDEFQDISPGQADLLKALKAQHEDARIFAVGDDWQSIYRFTGSDIRFMRNFGREFGGIFAGNSSIHQIVDLGRTFRSVDRIALPARSFVLKNPAQITKTVIPAGSSAVPSIRVAYSESGEMDATLQQVLENIHSSSLGGKDAKATTVLLLGRYHHLRPKNLLRFAKTYPNLSINFKTIHAAKGREADHVFILGAESGPLGFPSEIMDDPILDLVMPEPEKFQYAEERRLFYVALTRARKTVTIFTSQDNRSRFVKELVENTDYGCVEFGNAALPVRHECPKCSGRLVLDRQKKRVARFVCEHSFHCYTVKTACPDCGRDLPKQSATQPGMLVCSCGSNQPACPKCRDGWLVERTGRYGLFLGCVNYPQCNGRDSR